MSCILTQEQKAELKAAWELNLEESSSPFQEVMEVLGYSDDCFHAAYDYLFSELKLLPL